MPIIGVPLNPGITGAKVGELHAELLVLGAVIDSGEQTGKNYGSSTVAAVRAFQKRVGLQDSGSVDKVTGGIMALAALAAEEGDRALLRDKLRGNLDKVPNSAEYAYWLARYSHMAGDFQTAFTAVERFSDFGPILEIIHPALEVPRPAPGPRTLEIRRISMPTAMSCFPKRILISCERISTSCQRSSLLGTTIQTPPILPFPPSMLRNLAGPSAAAPFRLRPSPSGRKGSGIPSIESTPGPRSITSSASLRFYDISKKNTA